MGKYINRQCLERCAIPLGEMGDGINPGLANNTMTSNHIKCNRCGTCCINGGPALHKSDLPIIKGDRLSLGDLITIRPNEPVFSPLVSGIEPARTELIKISGQKDSWTCRFFDQNQNGCGIYAYRPMECRLLKCWETSDLTNVIYQNCLSRKDVLPSNEELWELIEIQEEHCSYKIISSFLAESSGGYDEMALEQISRIVTLDLNIRHRALQRWQLSLAEELLFFGRPLLKSLDFYQLAIKEGPCGFTVIPKKTII